MKPFYTRLYVELSIAFEDLLQSVAVILGRNIDMYTVATTWGEVDVTQNPDFVLHDTTEGSGEFIYYPYYVEVEANPGVSLKEYLKHVSTLMLRLAEEGATVVASCDWESELPGTGKIGPPFGESGTPLC